VHIHTGSIILLSKRKAGSRGACSPGLAAETAMTRKINVQLFANLLNNVQRNSSQRQLMHSLGLSLSMPSREAVDAKRFASKVVAQLARLYQYSRCLIVPWPGLLAKIGSYAKRAEAENRGKEKEKKNNNGIVGRIRKKNNAGQRRSSLHPGMEFGKRRIRQRYGTCVERVDVKFLSALQETLISEEGWRRGRYARWSSGEAQSEIAR